MPIRDANALRQVRDALWLRPRRGACVMVGSGLSRNHATPIHGEAAMPTWSDLADLLFDRLKDSSDRTVQPNKRRRTREHDSPNHPRSSRPPEQTCPVLAQQFEAMYGRDALDQFLRKHVPDDRAPHRIHTDLLRLPWADVFTTNWDTLLERASYQIRDAAYEPVFSGTDLSTAPTPRIVKLHGSFPSHRPFIVTEEDYRKYPQSHAPLVNTVRQALMERVVLLLGFSGDDQNFLHWLGWVRDHLGTAAPRLFVGGFLRLSHPRRRLLEDRGVVPIDLADHPKATTWGSDARRHAVEWILDALSRVERYEHDWPTPRQSRKCEDRPWLEPTLIADTEGPEHEPVDKPNTSDTAIRSAAVKGVLKVWQRNRQCYPRWVVLPFSKVAHLQAMTDLWDDAILSSAATWEPIERLQAIYELIWRYDLLMNPHPRDLKEAAEEAVRAFDQMPLSRNGRSAPDSKTVFDCRTAVSLSLLTDARFRFDYDEFGRLATDIKERNPTWTDFRHRLQHEQCLWSLSVQDFDQLRQHLDSWPVLDCDPIWALRKAALSADSGQYDAAMDLAERVLHLLERQAATTTDVRTMSPLSWALLWRLGKETVRWWATRFSGQPGYPRIFDKWAQSAQYECDSYSDWQQFKGAVKEILTPWPKNSMIPRPTSPEDLSMPDYHRYRAVRRAVRMTELAGFPARIHHVGMADEILQNAANAMAGLAVVQTLPIAMRTSGPKPAKMLSAVLTPGQVARLDQETTERIVQSLEQGRNHYLGQRLGAGNKDHFLADMACANIEALARVVSRASSEKAEELWRWAMAYGDRKHGAADFGLWESVPRLWQQSWKAIIPSRRRQLALEIVSSPTLEHPPKQHYGDPAEVLEYANPAIRREDYGDSEWTNCVKLLTAALYRGGESRKRACGRLHWLSTNGLLTDVESLSLGQALWHTRLGDHGMPMDTGMHDWLLLDMPEPETGLSEQTFRNKWILRDGQNSGEESVAETLAEVCNAWRTDVRWHKAIVMSAKEQESIWDKVHNWLKTRSPWWNYSIGHDNIVEWRLIAGLASVISKNGIPERLLPALHARLEILATPRKWRWSPLFVGNEYMLIAAAAGLRTGHGKRARVLMRTGMRSDNERVRNSALDGLSWWLTEAARSDTTIRPPSVTCVKEVGIILASRTPAGMELATKVAIAAMKSGRKKHRQAIEPLAKEGLQKWWEALQYGQADMRGTDWDKEIVNRRGWCVRLARTMEEAGHGDSDVVKKWLDDAKKDPMSPVRYEAEA